MKQGEVGTPFNEVKQLRLCLPAKEQTFGHARPSDPITAEGCSQQATVREFYGLNLPWIVSLFSSSLRVTNIYGRVKMNRLLTAALLGACTLSASSAIAQTTTTTTTTSWSDDQATTLNQSYTTSHYSVVTDPNLQTSVGTVLPGTVTFYPLPSTISVQNPDQYSYSVINNHPVVVERTTRRVVHTW